MIRLVFILFPLYGLIEILRSSFVIENLRYFTLFDDMMVSMRYAKHLAQGYGLVWNLNGDRVEGFSNLLWTLYMSLLHLLPHSPQDISLYVQLSGLLIMMINLFFVWKILNLLTKKRILIFFALVLTAFYFPLNNWGFILGTEVGILTLLVTISSYLTLKSIKKQKVNYLIYFLMGAATLVRMDALVPAIIIVASIFIGVKKGRVRALITGITVVALFVVAQEAFRIMYFGEWLPNTYYLKITGYSTFWRIMRGLYVLPNLMNWLLLLPVVIHLIYTKNKYLLTFAALFVGQVAYSIYVGGDAWENMGGSNRYVTIVMPIFFCLFVLSCGGIYQYLTANRGKYIKKKSFKVFAAFFVIAFLSFNTMSENMLTQTFLITPPATKFENENQVLIARSISDVTSRDAVVGIVWAGIVPHYAEREYIDLLGKNDKYIARQKAKLQYDPPRFFERMRLIWPGHNKWDNEYALNKKPDIFAQIFPGSEDEKILKGGYIKMADKGFGYYVRKDSDKIVHNKLSDTLYKAK